MPQTRSRGRRAATSVPTIESPSSLPDHQRRPQQQLKDALQQNKVAQDTIAELEQQLGDALQQNKIAQDTIAGLEHQLEDALQQNKVAQDAIAGLEQQLEDALRQNIVDQDAIAGMEQQLDEVQGKFEKARKERDSQRRIAEGGTLANSTKATDEAIVSKWKQLDYNIRSLASCMNELPKSAITVCMSSRFNAVTKYWHLHLNYEATRSFLCQGYLWDLVQDSVFNPFEDCWAGNKNQPLKVIKEKLIAEFQRDQKCQQSTAGTPSIQSIMRWSAQSSALVHHLLDHDRDNLDQFIRSEVEHFKPWFRNSANSNRSEARFWNELKAIFECALDIDQIFASSKAIFTTQWNEKYEGKERFNPDTMEAVAGNEPVGRQSSVQFFTSPTLYKRGNADGQNYDQNFVLIKASVVCD